MADHEPRATPRLAYFHGLRSGVDGPRARWMRENMDAVIVDYRPLEAIASSDAARARGEDWRYPLPDADAVFTGPYARAHEAIHGKQFDLLVGASFGAMLIVELMLDGAWQGPAVLLSCPARKLRDRQQLPADNAITLIHGLHDTIVPIADARHLANSPNVSLIEVDDDHLLFSLFDGNPPPIVGVLEAALGALAPV